MNSQLLKEIWVDLPGTATGWYLLAVICTGTWTYVRCLIKNIELKFAGEQLLEETEIVCKETWRNFSEFFLGACLFLASSLHCGQNFTHYFLGQNLDFENWRTYAFLSSMVLAPLLPLYSLVWARRAALRSDCNLLRDHKEYVDQRHLTIFVLGILHYLFLISRFLFKVGQAYKTALLKEKAARH